MPREHPPLDPHVRGAWRPQPVRGAAECRALRGPSWGSTGRRGDDPGATPCRQGRAESSATTPTVDGRCPRPGLVKYRRVPFPGQRARPLPEEGGGAAVPPGGGRPRGARPCYSRSSPVPPGSSGHRALPETQFFLTSSLNPLSSSLKPSPLLLSLQVPVKSLSPSFL